jgi:hypothetical protein
MIKVTQIVKDGQRIVSGTTRREQNRASQSVNRRYLLRDKGNDPSKWLRSFA